MAYVRILVRDDVIVTNEMRAESEKLGPSETEAMPPNWKNCCGGAIADIYNQD